MRKILFEVYLSTVTARLRWFDGDLGSEVVVWIDGWSVDFGLHRVDHAYVHDHLPCQFRFAVTGHRFLGPPPSLVNWWPSRLITLTFSWTNEQNVPLMPVRDIFLLEHKVLEVRYSSPHLHDMRLVQEARDGKPLQFWACGAFHSVHSVLLAGAARRTVRARGFPGSRLVSGGKAGPPSLMHLDTIARVDGLPELTRGCLG